MSEKLYKNRDWLVNQYEILGKTTKQIAVEFGYGTISIGKSLNTHNIPLRYKNSIYKFPQLDDYDWLYDEYIIKKRSTVDIGTELGLTNTVIRKALVRHNIPIYKYRSPELYPQLNDYDWIYNEYVIKQHTPKIISELIGCGITVITDTLHHFKIPTRSNKKHHIIPLLNNYDWMYNEYVINDRSISNIGIELGCHSTTVKNALNDLAIPIKPNNLIYTLPELCNRDWLYNEYITLDRSSSDIASQLNCSIDTIASALKLTGVGIKSRLKIDTHPQLNDYDYMYDMYIIKNYTLPQIAAIIKCNANIIKRHMKLLGVMGADERKLPADILQYLNDKEWLINQHLTLKKGVKRIGFELNTSYTNVSSYLKKHNIKKQYYKESIGEGLISTILDLHNIKYEREYFIYINGRKHFIDFRLSTGEWIEFDGQQHYEAEDHFGGEQEFIKRQARDKEKDEYCEANNIKLIRIPYWDIKNISEILTKKLGLI